MRALFHRAVDDAIDHLASARDRPVWRPTPPAVTARLHGPLPREPQGAEAAYRDFTELVLPYQMGNTHPRFWGWFMGNGTAVGALGDFLAAIVNPNMGGGNHVANHVEQQVVDWCKEMVGLPRDSGGLMVSGGSMANLVPLTVVRHVAAAAQGVDIRAEGVRALRQLPVFYASSEVHTCIVKAVELLGLGRRALRLIPVDGAYRMDVAALERAIAEDRAAGLAPACVIGTAGTINTGSVDPLEGLAALCRRERLWFHVDGAIGAALSISAHRGLVAGLAEADSVAMDLHKWFHVPFEGAVALVRDRAAHRATFAVMPEYLAQHERGLAASGTWFSEYGLQLSRGFKALKVWLSFKEHGAERFGELVDQNIAQASTLVRLIEATGCLELMAPAPINIVCFRYVRAGLTQEQLDGLNEELLVRLHESGVAAPTSTRLGGRYVLRVAIANHRTRDEDLELLVRTVVELGASLAAPPP